VNGDVGRDFDSDRVAVAAYIIFAGLTGVSFRQLENSVIVLAEGAAFEYPVRD
jgi:hypothetical protein